jgi:hypothetical protein
MTSASSLSHYPEEYGTLFVRAALGRVEVPCASHAEARNFRSRLYAYRRALLDEPDKAPEAALLAPAVRLLVQDTILIAEQIEPDTLLPALQKALEHAKRTHASSDGDAGPSRPTLPEADRQLDVDDGSIMPAKVLPRVR